MPYAEANDPYTLRSNADIATIRAGNTMALLTASGADIAAPYPKALRVEVVTGTAGPHITITPLKTADGTTFSLTLNEGETIIDWIRVRRVTAITAGVTVWRIDD